MCDGCGINNSLEIHHKDEDWKNNDVKNLQILCRECHSKKHQNITAVNQSFGYDFDKIVSIQKKGKEECYDISMNANENSASFIANGFIVHNCPHNLRTYRKDAWNKFYIFDVVVEHTTYSQDEGEVSYYEYLPYETYQPILKEFGLDYIPCIAKIRNPSRDQLYNELRRNTFLIQEGEGVGEGIVIKNYTYCNKYGRQTWANIVREEFKEKHIKKTDTPTTTKEISIEERIIDGYVTEKFIEKIYAKFVTNMNGWKSQYIPMLLNTVYHDLVTEELWNIVKSFKNPTIDFEKLQQRVNCKIKEIKSDLF